jgi:alkylation response protein AidB-like acyl-CoA dehydrogenase
VLSGSLGAPAVTRAKENDEMSLVFNDDDRAFRDEVRAFIAKRYPMAMRKKTDTGIGLSRTETVAWYKILATEGWLAPAWPVEHGGTGWPMHWCSIFEDELALHGCPLPLPFNSKMLGPILIAFGTEEQKAFYLPRILHMDDWWCQGYSEPGSGSDLASLRMSAELDGDEYVLNGSKIWTSLGHNANRMFCLVRTDPHAKPQEGISFILIDDLNVAGVQVRPIRFIHGRHVFNQVFFDDLRVPAKNIVGKVNEGWTVAKGLLAHERLNGARQAEISRSVGQLYSVAAAERSGGGRLLDEDWFARKLWRIEVDLAGLQQTIQRFVAEAAAGKTLGAETSMLKARGTVLFQAARDLMVDAVGYYGLPYEFDVIEEGDSEAAEDFFGPEYALTASAQRYSSRGSSIAGGSYEVQSMVTAKRVLGL